MRHRSTVEVSKISGLTLRQLQQLDETKSVSPMIVFGRGKGGRKRQYGREEVFLACLYQEFRARGIGPKKASLFVKNLDRKIVKRAASCTRKTTLLLTDGNALSETTRLQSSAKVIRDTLRKTQVKIFIICTTDIAKRIR